MVKSNEKSQPRDRKSQKAKAIKKSKNSKNEENIEEIEFAFNQSSEIYSVESPEFKHLESQEDDFSSVGIEEYDNPKNINSFATTQEWSELSKKCSKHRNEE
ncbi:hypothetical protein SteCoe_21061 [Stentor coeruleus]|uniref:Uncharacterized protein n=1 Tax=Stentor coeruleus TaxID=5963 RepID=A0A1R2BQP4_9CILI|nr:hypothetical protein SteCoe_21061 [Stentor coeruleus]